MKLPVWKLEFTNTEIMGMGEYMKKEIKTTTKIIDEVMAILFFTGCLLFISTYQYVSANTIDKLNYSY